jgi:hypothetical protein
MVDTFLAIIAKNCATMKFRGMVDQLTALVPERESPKGRPRPGVPDRESPTGRTGPGVPHRASLTGVLELEARMGAGVFAGAGQGLEP